MSELSDLLDKVAQAQPRWLEDGKGLRGDGEIVSRQGLPPEFPICRIEQIQTPIGDATQVDLPPPAPTATAVKQSFQLTGKGISTDTVEAGTINGVAKAKHTGALSGDVYGSITINSSTGAITAQTITYTGTIPADTATTFNVLIGNWDGTTLTQYRYGPIVVTVCRNWFSNPATYGVTFS